MKKSFWGVLILSVLSYPVQASPVDYEYDSVTYEGYYVANETSNAPLVLLIHDWDGLTDYEIKRANMLKTQGYSVFAVDLFGKGVRPTELKDRREHTGALYKDRAKMRGITQAALAKAHELKAQIQNAVMIGYCFGGAATLEFARSGAPLKGFVSIHGGLATPEGQDYSKTQGSVLVLHGAADDHIPMTQFADLANELEAHKVHHEMIAYGGAPHAWTVFEGDRYRAEADRKSWVRLLEYLKDTVE